MRFVIYSLAAALLALFSSQTIAQQSEAGTPRGECTESTAYAPSETQSWFAATTVSMAVTGDLMFSRDEVRFDSGPVLKLKYLGNFATTPERPKFASIEVSCVAIYEISPPFPHRIREKNNICGDFDKPPEPIVYLAATTYRRAFALGDQIHLTFFGHGSMPILGTALLGTACGEYDYGYYDRPPVNPRPSVVQPTPPSSR
jgi:hypothetical protein